MGSKNAQKAMGRKKKPMKFIGRDKIVWSEKNKKGKCRGKVQGHEKKKFAPHHPALQGRN